VAKVGGHDRVIAYEHSHPASLSSLGRLSWFDPESGTVSELVAVTSSFQPPRADEIPHVDVTRDVNGDGRDDLVVPDERGFWVFIQTDGGTFADPVMLGPPTDMSGILGADGYRYAPWSVGRIYEVDIDLDGRRDLAFWNEDHFEAHLQDERGMFSDVTESYVTEVEFDSDDVLFLASEDMTGRVLHSLADLNVDGTADLVVLSLEGRRNSQKRSVFEVYFGEPSEDGGLVFAGKVGAAFRSKGRIQLGMDPHVLRGDGQVALMFTTLENRFLGGNLWKRIKGAMGDDVWLELEFHQTVGGVYRNEPNATYRIALDGVPSHREPGSVPLDIALRGRTHESRRTRESWLRAFNRTLLIGDVTGDGRSDLLIEAEFQDLHVHVGVAGPELFAAKPQKVKVTLFDEEYIWLVDLNGDGKQDILQHHPFTLTTPHGAAKQPPGTEPHRVTTLIAR
ncbi:MAG: VCBS repeat-containing protein, partial [Acidobacteriota bacterium]|nr:VCBS repeat-containing protein [Acidobacteriota bacterium]